jgi:hypothetical protein
MNLARNLERRIESMVEGLTARVFRGRVQPVELASRLARECDLNLVRSPKGPVAPNSFTVALHPEDVDDPEHAAGTIAGVVEEIAAERGWRMEGPVEVVILTDPKVPTGGVEVESAVAAGARPAWAHLLEVDGNRRLAVRHTRALVGRGQDADILLGDAEVSRRHALLWREAGRVWVIDLNSSNGTVVNGVPAEAPLPIEPGDVITFGIASFTFRPT